MDHYKTHTNSKHSLDPGTAPDRSQVLSYLPRVSKLQEVIIGARVGPDDFTKHSLAKALQGFLPMGNTVQKVVTRLFQKYLVI